MSYWILKAVERNPTFWVSLDFSTPARLDRFTQGIGQVSAMRMPGVSSLVLRRASSPADIEGYFERISVASSKLERLVLHVPFEIESKGFGGLAALSQVILTWAHQSRGPRTVRTYFQSGASAESMYEKVLRSEHLLVAMMAADQVLDAAGADITPDARQCVESVLLRQNRGDSRGGRMSDEFGSRRRLTIVCQDHDSAQRATTPRLYEAIDPFKRPGEFRPKDRYAMATTLNFVLNRLLQADNRWKKPPIAEPWGMFLAEVWNNTHNWARYAPLEGDGIPRPMLPSIRGISARWTEVQSRNARADMLDPHLLQYFHHWISRTRRDDLNRPAGNRVRSFFELSIFDSGPGIAARRLSAVGLPWNSAPLDQQISALSAALPLGYSDDPSVLSSDRGTGFHRMLQSLSETGAYIRIRTGGVHVARDLIEHPYPAGSDFAEKDPFSRFTEVRANPQDAPRTASGTVIVVVMPLELLNEGRRSESTTLP